jgi:hypothetical protein
VDVSAAPLAGVMQALKSGVDVGDADGGPGGAVGVEGRYAGVTALLDEQLIYLYE